MSQGSLISIFLHTSKDVPLTSVPEAEVQVGGIVGDTYFRPQGTSKTAPVDEEVTLIEVEALEAIQREDQLVLPAAESRRNLLTRGIALNHLVDREFTVGNVRLRGIRLCEPCSHLEKLTQKGIIKALLHRGGLRAQVLEGGTIKVGDPITY